MDRRMMMMATDVSKAVTEPTTSFLVTTLLHSLEPRLV